MSRGQIFCSRSAFSFVEILVAVSIIAFTVGSSIVMLTHMNRLAQASRLYTGAQTVAQNHLDDAMNKDWNALLAGVVDPGAPLSLGTHYVIPNTEDADGDGLIAYYDADEIDSFSYVNAAPTKPNVPIYEEDPTGDDGVSIMGTVRVETTDESPGGSYFLRQIRVVVEYDYQTERTVELVSYRTAN